MRREDVIAQAFAEIDKHIRKASFAQVGGFRPSDNPITSWFGGKFFGLPGEDWPANDSGPMFPLLQVVVRELPFVPGILGGIKAFNIFVDGERLPVGSALSGEDWLIRTYNSVDELVPLVQPREMLKPFPIKWSVTESEAPGWEDAWSIFDLSEFNKLEDCIQLFYERYSSYQHTKVGGWPNYIQGIPAGVNSSNFVIQIGSETKCGWCWGDVGNAYIFFSDNQWVLEWDCY